MENTVMPMLEMARFLQCPVCRNGTIEEQEDRAKLICSNCKNTYPVVSGVPRFVPTEIYAGSFGMQWNIHREAQLDSHTGIPISRNRLFEVTGWPEDLRGQTILEAGCGAGRFTEVLASTGAQVLSFDLSAAVDANYANNGTKPDLLIFQGDVLDIPVRPGSMDKVLCLGVIQHTPDPEASFRSLARYVRPGGEIAIDVYAARLRSLVSWKYLLRPFTKRMQKERLYRIVTAVAPALVPLSRTLRRTLGQVGARLLPIVQYEHLGLSPALNREWAVLDTFDMYAPAHDHPQTLSTVQRWYEQAGFSDISVRYGTNGIVARGRRPATA